MKKVVLLSITALLLFSACTKEIIEESSIKFTDDPPGDMEKNRSTVFFQKEDLEKVEYYNRFCQYNSNTNQWDICDDLYKIPARYYWGISQGKTYVSASYDYYLVHGWSHGEIIRLVKEHASAIGEIQYWGWNNASNFNYRLVANIKK